MNTKWFDIAGTVYKVTEEGGHVFFHGVRGAVYALVPYTEDRSKFHVVNRKGHTPRHFSGLVFGVKDGYVWVYK